MEENSLFANSYNFLVFKDLKNCIRKPYYAPYYKGQSKHTKNNVAVYKIHNSQTNLCTNTFFF